MFRALWRRPSLRSLPPRATGSALCVMGGRLRFLGHAYSSYTCTRSTLDVMNYGIAKAKEFSNELTARTLLILRIIALGLTLQRFFEPPNSPVDARMPPETALSPAPPYTCYGLRTLRYGWSAAAPWSRLFLLHVHGLRARRYGLWAS